MRFSEEDLKNLGYVKDKNGNFSKPKNKQISANLQHKNQREVSKPQRNVRKQSKKKNTNKETVFSRYKICILSYRRRNLDPDNLCPKHYIDYLVEQRIIEDDSSKYIESIEKKVIKIDSKEEEYTEIQIYKMTSNDIK